MFLVIVIMLLCLIPRKKVIEINPPPNSPRSEAILQDLIKSLNTPA